MSDRALITSLGIQLGVRSPAVFLSPSKLVKSPTRSTWQRTTSEWRRLDFLRPDFCTPLHEYSSTWLHFSSGTFGKHDDSAFVFSSPFVPCEMNTQGAARWTCCTAASRLDENTSKLWTCLKVFTFCQATVAQEVDRLVQVGGLNPTPS